MKYYLALLIPFHFLFALNDIYTGPRAKRRDPVHADLKMSHPKVTPEFLSSFKPTAYDFEMGWVIVDESFKKYPEHITSEDLRLQREKIAQPGDALRPKITNRGEFLWTEGPNDLATRKNNEGLAFVLANDMDRAREIFEELRQFEPQFFPGRFNLGRVYLYFKQHREAIAEFDKCTELVPQYSKNYLYLGKGYELAARRDAADYNYLRAYKYDIYSLEPLVALGDSLLDQKRTVEALDTFKHCLKQDPGFNDALIGMGKVAYTMKKYYDATLWFRTVDTKVAYKKEFHFYYGESAFYSQDYHTASKHFETMLNFPQDAIYSKVSLLRMRKRLEQTKRLLNQTVDN